MQNEVIVLKAEIYDITKERDTALRSINVIVDNINEKLCLPDYSSLDEFYENLEAHVKQDLLELEMVDNLDEESEMELPEPQVIDSEGDCSKEV